MVDFMDDGRPAPEHQFDDNGRAERIVPRFKPFSDDPRKKVPIRACIIFDNNGNYFIHGSNSETPQEMFKAMVSLWTMDPSKESIAFVEFSAYLPDLDHITKPSF